MKKLIACASILALAACAEPATEEEPVVEEAVDETASARPGGPGTFEVTYEDGSVGTLVTAEDGTFTYTLGEESGTGTVSEVDGKACFDPDEEGLETNCWTAGEVAEDGSWTSTSDAGETVTVTPVAEAAAEAEADADA